MSFRAIAPFWIAIALACSPPREASSGPPQTGAVSAEIPRRATPSSGIQSKAQPEPPLLDRPLCPPADESHYCEQIRHAEKSVRDSGSASLALEIAVRLTQAEPNRPEAWVLRGRGEREREPLGYGEGGEATRRAIALFERAQGFEPGSPVVRLELARAWLSLGDAERALPALEALVAEFDRDPEANGALGVCLLALGRVREARARLERAKDLDPESPERWVVLGTAQMLLGELDQAEASFRAALHRDPHLTKAHGDLGALLLLRGRLDEGMRHLERALSQSPNSAAYLSNLAYGQYLAGRPEALATARKAVAMSKSLVSARLTLALILAAKGEVAEASREIQVAKGIDPRDPRVHDAEADLAELARERSSAREHQPEGSTNRTP